MTQIVKNDDLFPVLYEMSQMTIGHMKRCPTKSASVMTGYIYSLGYISSNDMMHACIYIAST